MGRRNAMEIQLTGTEVHELREVLESLLPGIEKEIASTKVSGGGTLFGPSRKNSPSD
jgi:hypothetical protein